MVSMALRGKAGEVIPDVDPALAGRAQPRIHTVHGKFFSGGGAMKLPLCITSRGDWNSFQKSFAHFPEVGRALKTKQVNFYHY